MQVLFSTDDIINLVSSDSFSSYFSVLDFSSAEERAVPGGTAIPGQPVAKVEQAPDNFA